MKIIKNAEQVAAERKREEFAKLGCDICPCCGECMPTSEAIKKGLIGFKRGISSFEFRKLVRVGLFKLEYMTVTQYKCYKCGAEWESDPY